MFIDNVCKHVVELAYDSCVKEVSVKDYCFGIKYAYVILETPKGLGIGLSYVQLGDIDRHGNKLVSKVVREINLNNLCEYLNNPSLMLRTFLTAYLNAVSSVLFEPSKEEIGKDILEAMDISSDDVVAVVGHIGPVVKALAGKVKDLVILERSVAMREDALPDLAAPRVLPYATKVIVTGSSVINDSIDIILQYSRNAEEVALVGASSAMVPESLLRDGVTVVGSFRVSKGKEFLVADVVKAAGGTREIYEHGVKYVVSK